METDKLLLKTFGITVQTLRKGLGLSQEELAYRAGFHRTYIGMIERAERNITLSNLKRLADALEVEIKDLF
ncbi:MAG: helix-turn-helix transcriptional regulator [Duncaniella sp.]|nr:helix-turn-helix transcriptional regulator [Duncaniella sp.]HBI57696.1 transcriptional regulator [Porphyromonadaceae bacterium]